MCSKFNLSLNLTKQDDKWRKRREAITVLDQIVGLVLQCKVVNPSERYFYVVVFISTLDRLQVNTANQLSPKPSRASHMTLKYYA